MKKFILSALVAATVLIVQRPKARAECDCWDLARWLRNHYCACWQHHHGRGPGCGPGCSGHGGHCGCGCGCHFPFGCGLLNPFGCDPGVPGPWYLYFPYNGQTQEIAGMGPVWQGGWNYEMHFRDPAPVGDWFTTASPGGPIPAAFRTGTTPTPPTLTPVPAPMPQAATPAPGVSTVSDQ